MRAIIIEEERFTEIQEKMALIAEKIKADGTVSSLCYEHNIPKGTWGVIVQDIHKALHFEFVRWAQSHGASCTKR